MDVEKREHLCTVDGNIIGEATMENSMEIPVTDQRAMATCACIAIK